MGYAETLKRIVKEYRPKVVAKEEARADLLKKGRGVYTVDELRRRETEIVAQRDEIIKEANYEIFKAKQAFLKEIENIDALKGDDINADAKLLDGTIELTTNDLEQMFDRNKGNRTMQQLIWRYALAHVANFGRNFIDRAQIEAAAENMTRYAYRGITDGIYYENIFMNEKNFEKIVDDALYSF